METPEPKYASFLSRLLAFIIDYFLVVLVLGFLIAIAVMIGFLDIGPMVVEQNGDMVRNLSESWKPGPYLMFASFWLYFTLMQCSAWGASVGKRVLGLYVVDEHGERLSFGRSALRSLGWLFSLFTFFVGFLVALIHPQRQSLHDLLARTYVKRW